MKGGRGRIKDKGDEEKRLAIHFSAVPYAEDFHAFVSVVDLVDDPIVADPDAPVVTRAG